MCNSLDGSPAVMCCKNELNLEKLCVECLKAENIKGKSIVTDDICAQSAEIKVLSVENEIANNICVSGTVNANKIAALETNTNKLCAQNASLQNACISNLSVGNINFCMQWKAAVGLSADQLYNLGTPINWDTIVNDPNGNVSLAPFSYTVPATGYYSITFDVNHHGLSGSAVISGTPVGQLTILKNGNLIRNSYAPFLTFSTSQNSALSTLALLNVGDVVTMYYNVFVMDSVLGLIPYVGTVLLEGNGEFDGKSGFAIHYLSSLECTPGQGGQACDPCPPVSLSCTPVVTPCKPN